MIRVESGAAANLWTIDPHNNGGLARGAGRITGYDSAGDALRKPILYKGIASAFRFSVGSGIAVVAFSIENLAGSAVKVRLKSLVFHMEHTAAQVLIGFTSLLKYSDATRAFDGTVLTKGTRDTNLSSDSNVVIRGNCASDGGAETILAFNLGSDGGAYSRQFVPHLNTAVGQVHQWTRFQVITQDLIQNKANILNVGDKAFLSTEGDGIDSTDHLMVSCVWDEF